MKTTRICLMLFLGLAAGCGSKAPPPQAADQPLTPLPKDAAGNTVMPAQPKASVSP